MKQEFLLRLIAETGYNVGFGAKKNFATYDLVEKGPGWISYITLAVGAYSLFIHELTHEQVTAALLLIGIASLFLTLYNGEKDRYDKEGQRLTQIFHRLRLLYFEVKSGAGDAVPEALVQAHRELVEEAGKVRLSKQVFLSDWYAHYKFFSQTQVDWVDEQLHFTIKDKLPLSLRATIIVIVGGAVILLICWKAGVLK